MNKPIEQLEFVVFDVETTGLSANGGDRIVEIAAIKIRGLKPIEEFHSLIDPRREISYGAYRVNRITSEMLKGAPSSNEVLPSFMDFVGDAYLVGHNIGFDLSFLINELSMIGKDWDGSRVAIDTLKLARRFVPELESYTLSSVGHFFEVVDGDLHRAKADVELTFRVFRKLLEIAHRKDIFTLDDLINHRP